MVNTSEGKDISLRNELCLEEVKSNLHFSEVFNAIPILDKIRVYLTAHF